jgi:hypothetical protein
MLHLRRATLVRGALVLVAPARPAASSYLPGPLLLFPARLLLVMVNHVFFQFRQSIFCPVPKPRAGYFLSNRFRNDALADPSMQGRTMNSYQPRRFGNRVSLHLNMRHDVAHVK